MEEPAFEPIPELVDEPQSDAGPNAAVPVEVPVELSVDIDIEAPAAPPEPQARRGVLPPPKSEGKRVQPLSSRGTRPRSDHKRPSASGLPSGMRAPGVPEQTDAEDTDILIASAVAALTEGDPADNSAVLLTPEALTDPATSVSALPAPSLEPEPIREERTRRGVPLLLWFGVAAAAVLVLLAITVSGGDDEPAQASSPSRAAVAVADPPPAEPAKAPSIEAAGSPELPASAVDIPPDVGAAWVDLEDTTDVGDGLAASLDVGSIELVEPDTDTDPEQQVSAAAEAKPKSGRGGKKRKRKSTEAAQASPRPAPTAPAKPPEDAAALLASARKALASGQSRKAYSLASKSRSAKRTSAALIVMTKAACRFGGASQAKSAFNQLSVSNRRGLRAECRNHGVRLGL